MPDSVERLRQVFDRHLDAGLHHGAQLAVFDGGDRVADFAGGVVEPDGEPTTPDRRHLLFSCTKPLAGVSLLQLVEDDALALDDRIVDHWPGYAEAGSGKADATVRHALSHQAGLPESPADGDHDAWTDWERVIAAIEDAPIAWPPGTDAVYHALTYGWLVGELVWRAGGRPIEDHARERVFDPLGMDDTTLRLPEDEPDDVATLVGFEGPDRAGGGDGDDEEREAAATAYNREAVHRAVQPAAAGLGTARDLARFYACLANGGALDGTRLLEPDTLDEATRPHSDLSDDGDPPEPYGLGFELGGSPSRTFGAVSPPHVLGHAGYGSSSAWADPEAGLGVAYVTNGIRDGFEHSARASLVAHAVRELFGG